MAKKGWDIDGVVANFVDNFAWVAELDYGIVYPPWHEWPDWYGGLGRDVFESVWDHIHMQDWFWLSIPVLPGVRPFAQDIPVDMWITARPIPSAVTSMWLQSQGFPSSQSVLSIPDKYALKVDEIIEHKIDIYVDDKVEIVRAIHDSPLTDCVAYLIDSPSNIGVDMGELEEYRVHSVEDAIAKMRKMECLLNA